MALSNQATINLAVNVQNMAGLRSLTTGLMALKTQIMAIQRSPTMRSANGAVGTPAQQAKQAAALQAAQIKGLAQIKGAQAQLTTQAGKLAAAQARLAKASQNAATAMRRQRDEARSLTDRIKTAEENVDALWRAAFRLQMLGADFTRWGQTILGGLKGITDQFGEFEFMANRAAGSLRLFNTDGDSAALSTHDLQNAVMDTAQELRLFPADDVAKSVYFWGSTTGQVVETQEDLESVMASLTPVMKAAALTQTEYETAIKGVYGIMTQFSPEVIEAANATGEYAEMAVLAEEVTTRLFFAAQVTSLEFSDLVESFKMVGPVAAGVGADLEDMVGLIGRLADLGIRGSMAGRSFRQMFMRMASPPGPARKAIEALFKSLDPSVFGGKTYMEMVFPEGDFAGTANFFEVMTKAVKDLNTVERINFLTKFSTANLLPTMIALIGQEERAQAGLGGETDKTNISLKEQKEVFDQSWRLLTGSWKGATEGAARSIENLQLVIGRALAESFRPFLDQITEFFGKAREWAMENEDLIQQIGQWAGALGVALVALGALFTAVGSAIGIVAGLRLAFEAFGGVILRWTGYGIVIGGFIDAIIRNFDMVQERLQEAQAAIQRAIENVQGYFSDGEDQVGDFAETFRDLMDTIVDHTTNAIVFVAHFIEEVSKIKPLFDLIKNVGIPIMTNFIGIMLGARILAAAAGMLKITAAVTGIATAISNLQRARAVQNLQAATGGLKIISDNGISSGIERNDVAIRKMGISLGGLATSFKNFAMANPLLVLSAVAGFAFAAYENDWFDFKSLVDGVTDSFRDLKKEYDALDADIRSKNAMKQFFEKQDASGLISSFQEAKDWISNNGLLGDLTADLDVLNMREKLKSVGQFYSAAVLGTGDAEKAFADLAAYIDQAGYSFDEWSRSFMFAQEEFDWAPDWAQSFATALSESMEDGTASIDELKTELLELGLGTAVIDGLTEVQLEYLGIVTRSAEETAALAMEQERLGTQLMEQLATFPTTALTETQLIEVGTIIDQLNDVALQVGPEFRDTIDRAIAPYMTLSGEDLAGALGDGFVAADPAQYVMDYFEQMGAVSVPSDLFADVTGALQTAMGEAMALTPGADINVEQLLQKVFSDLKIEVVTDWLYPKINALGDGVASAIGAVFRPEKFKDKLKDITKDKKGWQNFWKAVTDPIFQAALAGKRGSEAQAIAEDYAQELFGNFETAFPAAAGPARDRLAEQLKGFFNARSMPGMSESLQRFGTNLLVSMYDNMDQPMPQWLRDYYVGFGGQIPGFIVDGAEGEQVVINPDYQVERPNASASAWIPGWLEEQQATLNNNPLTIPTPRMPTLGGRAGEGDGGLAADPAQANLNQFLSSVRTTIETMTPPVLPAPNDLPARTAMNQFVTDTESAIAGMDMTIPAIVIPDTAPAKNAIALMKAHITGTLTALNISAQTWGNHLAERYATGIRQRLGWVSDAARDIAAAARGPLHFTRPDWGPLRDLHKWGAHLVEIYARAMESKNPRVRNAARNIAAAIAAELRRGRDIAHKAGNETGHAADKARKKTRAAYEEVRRTGVASVKMMRQLGKVLGIIATQIARAQSALKAGNAQQAANIINNIGKQIARAQDILDKATKRHADRGRDTVNNAKKNNKDIANDVNETTKRIIDNVRGAHTFKNYDAYLDYLDRVHSRIKVVRERVKKDRDDTVRDLTVSKNDKDSRIVYESKNKKVIEIRLIAESPDGTVDRVELRALRRGIMDALALADLEHIVTVK
jgi:TP901 family phage tail tape measure protein